MQPRLPVHHVYLCMQRRIVRLLFIGPQVRFECKRRKKGPASLVRLSLSLSLSRPVAHYEIILRRVAVCTPHLHRRVPAPLKRTSEQIWILDSVTLFLLLLSPRPSPLALRPRGQLLPSFLPSFVLPAATSMFVFVCIIVDFGRPLPWMTGRRAVARTGRSSTDRKFCPRAWQGLGILR